MKIAFFGDSLTEGFPGVAYIDLLKDRYPGHELFNFGKGGDTVISLKKRIKTLSLPAPFDIAFLWIGVNDVFVKTSWIYPSLKTLRRQPWAKNHEAFEIHYRKLLGFLREKTGWLIAVYPLLIGEDLKNPWNRELVELGRIIEKISGDFDFCKSMDLRKVFVPKINPESVSPYVPKSFLRILKDLLALKTTEAVEKQAILRGLQLTLDGIHLNGTGAALVAEAFSKAIEERIKPGKHSNI